MSKAYTAYERALAVHIGKRIEARRRFLRLTQKRLAQMLDLKCYQHIYRYESGQYMISATRFAAIAHALNMPMDHFVQGFTFAPEPTNVIPS